VWTLLRESTTSRAGLSLGTYHHITRLYGDIAIRDRVDSFHASAYLAGKTINQAGSAWNILS
jgi:hypothetical protein